MLEAHDKVEVRTFPTSSYVAMGCSGAKVHPARGVHTTNLSKASSG
jgi:hypothetical protein